MDDFTNQINALLGPDGMQKLQEMANVLVGATGGAPQAEQPQSPPPQSPPAAAPPPQAAPSQPTMNQQAGQSMPNPNDLMAMANMLQQFMGGGGGAAAPGSAGGAGAGGGAGFDPGMLMRMGQVMQQMNRETPDTQLLQALRPHLRGDRASRVDEAMNIMRMMSVLPALQQGGFFGGGHG